MAVEQAVFTSSRQNNDGNECFRCGDELVYDGKAMYECTRCQIFISSRFIKTNGVDGHINGNGKTDLQETREMIAVLRASR